MKSINKVIDEKEALNVLESAGRKLSEMGPKWVDDIKTSTRDTAQVAVKSIDQRAHERPWQMIGAAALACMAVGFIFGRRRKDR